MRLSRYSLRNICRPKNRVRSHFSFSFDFLARDKSHALAIIESYRGRPSIMVPACVLDFLEQGVKGLPEPKTSDSVAAIKVSAQGHLCSGEGSYEVSSAQITITPMRYAPTPAPALAAG